METVLYNNKITHFFVQNISLSIVWTTNTNSAASCEKSCVLCNKNTSSANDSQTTHKMGEKYLKCNRIFFVNDLYELYKYYLHNKRAKWIDPLAVLCVRIDFTGTSPEYLTREYLNSSA